MVHAMPSEKTESEVRSALMRHFQALGYWNASESVALSMSLDGMRSRLDYVASRVPPEIFSETSRVLVSGMEVGGEMLVARERGAGCVHGIEVDPVYVDLCRRRFDGLEGLFPLLYEGKTLPFEPASFDLVLSGHIIEHTREPRGYLEELLRVLRPDGWLFLEFPTRFHWRELHTSLPSVEWLPSPARNGVLRFAGGRFSPFGESVKQKCRTILGTGLKQISAGGVRRWLAESRYPANVVDLHRPAPGIVRCLIRGAILGTSRH
jgi:SAM-dependent methyltransferase